MILLALLDLVLLTIAISLIDYILFYKLSTCPKCGKKPVWWAFLPATVAEMFMFWLGIFAGYVLIR